MTNVGTIDKVIRAILVIVFAYFGTAHNVWWYLLSGILFLTIVFGYCPIYSLINVNTCCCKNCECEQKEPKKTVKKSKKK